jgi:hypothetical protein
MKEIILTHTSHQYSFLERIEMDGETAGRDNIDKVKQTRAIPEVDTCNFMMLARTRDDVNF